MRLPDRICAVGVIAVITGLLAACGPLTGSSSTTSPGATPSEQAQGADAAGNENSVIYDNARFHYRVAAPGAMVENPDGSAAFKGQVERFEVHVVTGGGAADPSAAANTDLAQLRSSAPSFRLETDVQKVQLSGRQGVKFVYSWVDGTSPVTGKPVTLVTARYYIPKDGSTMAVLAYSSLSSQYDPQGADDIAMTFQWR